ncbi:MAG TPA: hypothetical protein VFA15_04135 [Nitrososphaera sp.]|nr:hypothetical protein [Nitrososphaera sp.]
MTDKHLSHKNERGLNELPNENGGLSSAHDYAANAAFDLDSFGEKVYSIFSEPSSSSLSTMTGEQFQFKLNGVAYVGMDYLDRLSSLHPEDVCGVCLKAEGEMKAAMLLFLDDHNARLLAARLLGQKYLDKLDSLGRSSISEVGNILFAGCFLNSVCKITGLKTLSSVPGLGIGNLLALAEHPITHMASSSDELLAAESELVGKETGITLKILLVLGRGDAQKLLNGGGGDVRAGTQSKQSPGSPGASDK